MTRAMEVSSTTRHHPIIAVSPPSAQPVVPRWCTPLRSREWDTGASQATLHVPVYSGCPNLPRHTMLPAPETLERTRTCPHQGACVPQTVHAVDDADVPSVYEGESTERRPTQRRALPHLPTHRAILRRPRSHALCHRP